MAPDDDERRELRTFTAEEVKKCTDEFLVIIEDNVYKLPDKWRNRHPGGEILLDNAKGQDITIPFLNNHREEIVAPLLKRFLVGKLNKSNLSKMETEFVELMKRVQGDPKWFKADPFYYGFLACRYAAILATSIYCVLYGESTLVRVVLGGMLMGFYFQQLAFLGHDLGHNGITHNRSVDHLIAATIGNATNGISISWWKATHNVHHLVTNSVEYDCDIQHMPFFAVSPKFFESIYSKYHFRVFEFDKFAQLALRYQHILYYPILALARFNLYVQSFILLFQRESEYRRRGGQWRMVELATLGFFWSWFSMLVSTLPGWQEKVAFLLWSHACAGLLHVQITISHFPMPVIDGNPMDSGMNFIEYQLAGSMDVDCSPNMDWFHGGLQFQAIHHLLPRIPRHNLRKLREEEVLPFCKRHGLEYKHCNFVEANKLVIRTLKETADEIHPYLEHAWHAVG